MCIDSMILLEKNRTKSQVMVVVLEVHQSCPSLCDPMDCSPPDSTVHRILQARILEWVATPSTTGSSNPGIKPRSPALQQILYCLSHQGSHKIISSCHQFVEGPHLCLLRIYDQGERLYYFIILFNFSMLLCLWMTV